MINTFNILGKDKLKDCDDDKQKTKKNDWSGLLNIKPLNLGGINTNLSRNEIYDEKSNVINILPRFVKENNGLRPFQEEAIDAITYSDYKIIFVEAPVGAGKSYIFQKIITSDIAKEKNIVITYPTKLLMDTQISVFKNKRNNVAVWPDDKNIFPLIGEDKINILKYSTDALIKYYLNNPIEYDQIINKGKLISSGLFNLTFGSNKIFVTTPDVLHLIYSDKYKNSKELQSQLKGSIVFVDEFHIYYALNNFYNLIDNLINCSKVEKVIMLSATPYIKDEKLESIVETRKIKYISFNDSTANSDMEGKIFNYPLNIKIHNFKYTDIKLCEDKLFEIIPDIKTPAAIIFDSIFRLKHIKNSLLKFDVSNNGNFKIKEWNGLEKSKDVVELVNNKENIIILGTSSIEAGIDLKLKSLITEANYWTNAIQRIGRVGRTPYNDSSIDDNSGFVHLFINSYDLPILLKDKEIYSRNEFENILIKCLKNPKNEDIYSSMFRGTSYNFILKDDFIEQPMFYSQNIFSIYDIQENECINFRGTEKNKISLLKENDIKDERMINEIILRDKLFPFWGLLISSGLRKDYEKITSIEGYPQINPETIQINTESNFYKFSRKINAEYKLPEPSFI